MVSNYFKSFLNIDINTCSWFLIRSNLDSSWNRWKFKLSRLCSSNWRTE